MHYKRRENGDSFLKNNVPLHNGHVVPYNRDFLLYFDAHVNVEYCGWRMLIKYLFKYISKGIDRIRFVVSHDDSQPSSSSSPLLSDVDEISNYIEGRYICPYEAVWCTLSFSIHHRYPAVLLLSVHLDGMQNLTFRDNQSLVEIAEDDDAGKTTLTQWFAKNFEESQPGFTGVVNGLGLRYVYYLTKYHWDQSKKIWLRRITSRTPSVGRLAYVHPSCGELFYLRLLLNHQIGCCSFKDVRTVSGVVLPTYRSACDKLGLIGNDVEWSTTIEEAALWATTRELRALFAHMLLYCDISDPLKFWQEHW